MWEELTDSDKRSNNFIFNHLNHIPFCVGDKTMDSICKLFPIGCIVYIQGLEKTIILQEHLPKCEVINADTKKLSTLPQPWRHIVCPMGHHSCNNCATVKVYKLYYFLLANTIF
jgi:hypothetical protein